MFFKQIRGKQGSFDEALREHVDRLFASENLTQVILHAHLLLEQGLNDRLAAKLARPEVLDGGRFPSHSFAQKIAMYVGLYDPEEWVVNTLQGFNRLRNTIAHQIADETEAVFHCLPADFRDHDSAIEAVIAAFGSLAFFELRAIHGLRRVDEERPNQSTQ
jgi:hypothetical protein